MWYGLKLVVFVIIHFGVMIYVIKMLLSSNLKIYSTLWLHSGQVLLRCNHCLIHSLWKKCLSFQGNVITRSPCVNSINQIDHASYWLSIWLVINFWARLLNTCNSNCSHEDSLFMVSLSLECIYTTYTAIGNHIHTRSNQLMYFNHVDSCIINSKSIK